MDLLSIFERLNEAFFDGFLDPPTLRWNARLRSNAGRFVPGSRRHLLEHPPVIEIASYLRDERDAAALVADTLGHELIHYWLWVRQRPYGHTAEFLAKLAQMGVPRYNPVARARPYRYVYRCPACAREFLARKKLSVLACEECCQRQAGGKFDARFKLILDRKLTFAEGVAARIRECPNESTNKR